jgi:uncharacterized protein YxjI
MRKVGSVDISILSVSHLPAWSGGVTLVARPEAFMATYTVKKRLVSVGRDYDVHDESGAAVFTIDGKVRFARTFDVKDRAGQTLYSAKEQLLKLDQTFLIDALGADQLAVKRTTTASVYP